MPTSCLRAVLDKGPKPLAYTEELPLRRVRMATVCIVVLLAMLPACQDNAEAPARGGTARMVAQLERVALEFEAQRSPYTPPPRECGLWRPLDPHLTRVGASSTGLSWPKPCSTPAGSKRRVSLPTA